jgi:LysM repeat protein
MRVLLVFLIGFSCLPVLNAEQASGAAAAAVDTASLPGMADPNQPELAAGEGASAGAEGAAAEAAAPEMAEPREAAADGTYQVRDGDTLWDLAASFLKNPYDWSRIWDLNKAEIANPDLIYPDQKVRIPGAAAGLTEAPAEAEPVEEAAAPEPEAEPAEEPAPWEDAQAAAEEAPAPKTPAAPPAKAAATVESMVVDKKWKGDGRIIGDVAKKIMISQGDLIYVSLGAAHGAKPRMRADVYRKGQSVREYQSGKRVGQVMKRVAVIEMTQQVEDKTSVAVIITSYEPVKLGDFVKLKN